jgi:hypothetical protein
MSELKVNKISPRSGTDVTLGDSGDTFTVPAGASIVNNGTATGFGLTWQSVQTTGFTAVKGNAYPCNTTSAGFTVTLPATPSAGDQVQLVDYAGTFDTNNLTIDPNGEDIEGGTDNLQLIGEREGVILTYIDSTQGWIATSGINEGTDALETNYPVDYLVIAGGGGGGDRNGGGGGAGGFVTGSNLYLVNGVQYTVTIGAGGAKNGNNGSDSSLGTLVSALGGGSASYDATPIGANSGGSGGGGAGGESGDPPTNGASGTAGQGNAGGNGANTNAQANRAGGGGGGAGGVGGNASTSASTGVGGAGGNGQASSISGSSITRGGGGGGGVQVDTGTASGGAAGSGGGGTGALFQDGPFTIQNSTAGGANTGGGGGGGARLLSNPPTSGFTAQSGGSGVLIISYPGSQRGTGGTVTSSGGNTIHTFTSSGTYTG